MSAVPRMWRPKRSTGSALGLAITVLALVCAVVVIGAGIATTSTATRVACAVGGLVACATFLVALLGTWWCWTLRYALSPTALEVRYGSRHLRLGYDEIDGVAGRASDDFPFLPTLWPGAYFGQIRDLSLRVEVWRSTTRTPRDAVVVSTAGTAHVVTPADVAGFREELIQRARSTAYAASNHGQPARSAIDAIANVDLVVRGLLLSAGVVAAVGIGADVARFGASQPDGIAAATILLANGIAAVGLSTRWLAVARFLAAGALVGQLLALF